MSSSYLTQFLPGDKSTQTAWGIEIRAYRFRFQIWSGKIRILIWTSTKKGRYTETTAFIQRKRDFVSRLCCWAVAKGPYGPNLRNTQKLKLFYKVRFSLILQLLASLYSNGFQFSLTRLTLSWFRQRERGETYGTRNTWMSIKTMINLPSFFKQVLKENVRSFFYFINPYCSLGFILRHTSLVYLILEP